MGLVACSWVDFAAMDMASHADYYSDNYVKKSVMWNRERFLMEKNPEKRGGHALALGRLGDVGSIQMLIDHYDEFKYWEVGSGEALVTLLRAGYGAWFNDDSPLQSVAMHGQYWTRYVAYWLALDRSLTQVSTGGAYKFDHKRDKNTPPIPVGYIGHVKDPLERTSVNEPYIQILKEPKPDFSEANTIRWEFPEYIRGEVKGWTPIYDVVVDGSPMKPLTPGEVKFTPAYIERKRETLPHGSKDIPIEEMRP